MLITLPKSKYSELVVRKSLYWLSRESEWILEENNDVWSIKFLIADSAELTAKFHRHLNDYILREKLDSHSNELKAAIIKKSLQGFI